MDSAQQFEQATNDYLADLYEVQPIMATAMGVHAYDDRLPDVSPYAFQDDLRRARAYLHAIDRISLPALPPEARIDYRLARASAQTTILELERVRRYETQPSVFVDELLFGLYLLIEREHADIETRAAAMLGRLSAAPGYLEQARANLTSPAPIHVEIALETLAATPDFFQQTLANFIAGVGSKTLRGALSAAAEGAQQALLLYRDHVRDTLGPAAAGEFALGRELFDYTLRIAHFMDEDGEALLDIGRDALARTRADMHDVACSIDPSRGWQEIVEDLKREHPSSDELLDAYRNEMERARDFIELKRLAEAPPPNSLEVRPTPAFARPTLPYAAYLPPAPFEADQRGQFWVTPVDDSLPPRQREIQLQGHSRYSIAITAVHEGFPGHHLQLSRANRVPSRFRRHFGNSTLFAEGWALYCEQLMFDVGFYTDPRIRLMQLKDQLWRACRVIVDVELHRGGMSVSEAAQFLVREARLERAHAEAEVKRYTLSPTQPMSYIMGKRQIAEIRDRLERRAGARFDLRRFHNDLLSYGTIPPRLIAEDMGLV